MAGPAAGIRHRARVAGDLGRAGPAGPGRAGYTVRYTVQYTVQYTVKRGKKIHFFEVPIFAPFFCRTDLSYIIQPEFYATIISDTDFSRRSRQYRFERDLTGSRGTF